MVSLSQSKASNPVIWSPSQSEGSIQVTLSFSADQRPVSRSLDHFQPDTGSQTRNGNRFDNLISIYVCSIAIGASKFDHGCSCARAALLPETANYINVCKNVEFHLKVGTILKNKALKTLNNV